MKRIELNESLFAYDGDGYVTFDACVNALVIETDGWKDVNDQAGVLWHEPTGKFYIARFMNEV